VAGAGVFLDDGIKFTETCRSCFNVNFSAYLNIVF